MEMTPSVTSSRPAIIRKSVDFPQPEGPTSTMNSPSGIINVTSSTARTPPANSFVTWSSSIAAIPTCAASSVARLHRAHDVYACLERHVAGVNREHRSRDCSRFVAREVDDEGRDLFGSRDREDVEACDRGARVRILQPDHLGLGRDEARCDRVHAHSLRSDAGSEGPYHRGHAAFGCG